METGNPVWEAIKKGYGAARRHPVPSIGLLGGSAVAFNVFDRFQTGNAIMSALFGEHWFANLQGWPYYPWLGAVVALACFLYLGWASRKDERKFAEIETEKRESISEGVKSEIRLLRDELLPHLTIVDDVAEIVMYQTHYLSVRSMMVVGERTLAEVRLLKNSFGEGANVLSEDIHRHVMPIYTAHDIFQRAAATLDEGIVQQSLLDMNINPTAHTDNSMYVRYDPSINGLFANNVNLNIEILETNHGALSFRLGQLENILDGKKELLWARFRTRTM